MTLRAELEALLRAGLDAVDPTLALQGWVPRAEERLASRPVSVVAAGKAAGAMARAVASAWGARITRGLVVTRDGHDPGPEGFVLHPAGHPLPDERSVRAGAAVLAAAAEAPAEGAFVLLLSGGASALLTAPADGLSLADVQALTDRLMRAGADIEALNTVRKHVTRASGGRVALACRAGLIEVAAISDVPGDDLATIGSGPCAPDPTSCADAARIVAERLGRDAPRAVVRHLREAGDESPGPEHPVFERVRHEIVASNEDALRAIEAAASARGIRTLRAETPLAGEAREAARRLAAEARMHRGPLLLLAGGETTVTVHGRGRGGRNQELALWFACEAAGTADLAILAAGTDGTDGPTDAAGAFADAETALRGRVAGVDAGTCLADNDSFSFFDREGGLLRTGPTGTNVMDVALVAIGALGVTRSGASAPTRTC